MLPKRIIGITGTIGSGKSSVGKILQEKGIPVIDSDGIVHSLYATDEKLKDMVVYRFGDEILTDGAIDRKALGKIIFNDQRAKRELEQMVHPLVAVEFTKWLESIKDKDTVAMLIPLLFESGMQNRFTEIWAICTDEAILKQRVMSRDKVSEEEINKRLAAQWSQTEKANYANHVIDNSGTLEKTKEQISALLQK